MSRLGLVLTARLFRVLVDSTARRVISMRYDGREDALLNQIWADAATRWGTLPGQSTVGAALMVRLAAVTAAAYDVFVRGGASVEDATQTVHDVAWAVYKKMGRTAWLVSGILSRDTAERLRIATVAFRTFPFSAPSYEWKTVPSPTGVVGFDCLKCPVADYFKRQSLSDLCVHTWCALDFPLAAEVWEARLERSGSIAAGASHCDFRWQAKATPERSNLIGRLMAMDARASPSSDGRQFLNRLDFSWRSSVKRKAMLLAACVATLRLPATADGMTSSHKADVEQKSMQVMPFSMDATKHVFTPTTDGGMQAVIVINGDRAQVPLVRSHLRKEANAFATGNFADPTSIHGPKMSGITVLNASKGRMIVRYGDVANGAKITFQSADTHIITALHQWFAAQVGDHGAHATMKM